MTYLKVFTDFRELMAPLNDEEKGRLFEAMLCYAEDSNEPVLEGNERFVWPVARRTIDREAETYQEKVKSAGKARKSRWQQASVTRGGDLISENASLVSENGSLVPDKENENEQENDKEYEQEQEKEKEDLKELSQEYVCVSKENAPARADTHTPERKGIETCWRERGQGVPGDRALAANGPRPG